MQEKECVLDEGRKTLWPRALRWSADRRTTKELLEKKIFKNEKVTIAFKYLVMKAQEYGLTQPFAETDSLFVSLLNKEYDNYLGKRKTIAEAALNTSILKPILGAVLVLGGHWAQCDYVYMPINIGNHWILAVLDISKKWIKMYDSNHKGKTCHHTKPYLPCLQILLPKVMDKLEVYKERKMPEMGDDVLGIVNVNDCPQQQDTVSCGVFVVKVDEHLIMGMGVDEVHVAGIESFREKNATEVLLYANMRAEQEG
ncbi:unnamed protein product [Cuscuta campestris]|uniref:Ubiquitin-like protease family profile domain-containing protein n=1 Tax=Cuscuta campestris TaxID=132261 RepID=A0A484MGN7_9ASTE|nr:unnamed protein product [Cuscuta campestris]